MLQVAEHQPQASQNGYMPGFTTPAEELSKQQQLEAQPTTQAEKLLSKPFLIPRNPWALLIRVLSLQLLADVALFTIGGLVLALLGSMSWQFALVLVGFVFVLKMMLTVTILFKMAADWVPDNYQITDRQLIVKSGITNKADEIYELANIRAVTVHQSFVGRQLEYGNIELLVATAGLNQTILLQDVKDPQHFEEIFAQYVG